MDFLTIGILGLVQALTEFLPISSSGHLILAREFLGQNVKYGLSVDAVLQLATTLSIAVYFRKDIFNMFTAFFKLILIKPDKKENRRLIIVTIIATIPAVILGLFLEEVMETTFRNPLLVVGSLLLGAFVMWLAELKLSKNSKKISKIENINNQKALKIGLFQTLALIPGMSRSGMTISGGLFSNLSREMATRFSFIIAFPILFGSGLKELFDLYSVGLLQSFGPELLLGVFVSFVVGLIVIHFLILYLKNNSLKVFIWYRVVLALILLIILI